MTLIKSTLSEQIYQILRSDILHQKILLGEKLTLKNLKERFEVSSTPIREALTRLTEDGLVNYYSNVGVNVISFTERDIIELYQFMGDLDRLAILYSSEHPEQARICDELAAAVAITGEIPEEAAVGNGTLKLSKDPVSWIESSDRFHLIFYDYCRNQRLVLAAEKQRSQLTIFSNRYGTHTQAQIQINEMHVDIYEAYYRGDYTKAGDLMKEHLQASLEHAKRYL